MIDDPSTPSTPAAAGNSGPWAVYTDDNFHLHDSSERDSEGAFATYGEALEECRRIVTKSLRHLYAPGMSSERLYEDYTDFGDDPFIVPQPADLPPFSAWDYAEGRAKEIVAEANEPSADSGANRGNEGGPTP